MKRLVLIVLGPIIFVVILQHILWSFFLPLGFLLFHSAILFSAFFGGLIPGIASTFISVIVARYFFIPPFQSLRIESVQVATQLITFTLLGLTYSWVCQKLRDAIEKLERNEKKFRVFVEAIPQLAWMAHGDGFIFWYNQRWCDYTGMSVEQAVGWGWQSCHHPDYLSTVLEGWKKAISLGESFEMEFPLRGADETFKWFLTRVVPIKDLHEKVVMWFGTNTDIDQQIKTRESLKEQVSLRDEFSSIISHELKTPLTSLKLQLQILERSIFLDKGEHTQLSEKFKKFFLLMAHQVAHLEHLVEDLMDVSRIQFGKLIMNEEEVDVSLLLKEVVDYLSEATRQAKLIVETKIQDRLITICDPRRMEQVFVNLISNAIKYAPGFPLLISATEGNGLIVVRVKDHGPGIPAEKQALVFDRFERADAAKGTAGLGLGLFIVKQIVDSHQGKISIESIQGEGSTFVVEIPKRVEKVATQ